MADYKPKATVEKTEPKITIRVSIQSLFDARIIKVGLVSGERYEWSTGGAVVSVDERDVPDLLAYKIGTNGCCGGNGTLVFQILQ